MARRLSSLLQAGHIPQARSVHVIEGPWPYIDSVQSFRGSCGTIIYYDLLSDTSTVMPHCEFFERVGIPYGGDILRLPGLDIVGTNAGVRRHVAGEVWLDTVNGFRLPYDQAVKTDCYTIKGPVRLPDLERLRLNGQGSINEEELVYNERVTGQRLLEPLVAPGLVQILALQEATPEGGSRGYDGRLHPVVA